MSDPLPRQELAPAGRLILRMIERTLRARFHRVEAVIPDIQWPRQIILVANHHGWHDGYAMLALARRLRRPVLDWIAEFDLFPPFAYVGGLPFPAGDASARAATIRRTIRMMRAESRSLLLFPEGVLHAGPEVLPFGRSVETIVRAVPDAAVVPVSIAYELVFHERPVARLVVGTPIEPGDDLAPRARASVVAGLSSPDPPTTVLVGGTRDVSERLRFPAGAGHHIHRWMEKRYRR